MVATAAGEGATTVDDGRGVVAASIDEPGVGVARAVGVRANAVVVAWRATVLVAVAASVGMLVARPPAGVGAGAVAAGAAGGAAVARESTVRIPSWLGLPRVWHTRSAVDLVSAPPRRPMGVCTADTMLRIEWCDVMHSSEDAASER